MSYDTLANGPPDTIDRLSRELLDTLQDLDVLKQRLEYLKGELLREAKERGQEGFFVNGVYVGNGEVKFPNGA